MSELKFKEGQRVIVKAPYGTFTGEVSGRGPIIEGVPYINVLSDRGQKLPCGTRPMDIAHVNPEWCELTESE